MTDVVTDHDLVIAVCDSWSVADPVRADTDAAFEAAFTDLAGRIERLTPALIA